MVALMCKIIRLHSEEVSEPPLQILTEITTATTKSGEPGVLSRGVNGYGVVYFTQFTGYDAALDPVWDSQDFPGDFTSKVGRASHS
jgi:hypothetical protein